MKRYALALITLLLLGAAGTYWAEISQLLLYFIYLTAGLAAMVLVTLAVALGWLVVEKVRLIRARRIEAEKEAHVLVVTNQGQTYIRDLNGRAHWRAMHLDPRYFANGHLTQPDAGAVARWQTWQILNATTRSLAAGQPPVIEALPAPAIALPPPPELLPLLSREQRLLLLGPSGSGKSSLLRHVVAAKLTGAARVILCDPHGSRPKWGSAIDAIGFGEDYQAILDTFLALEWEHKQRIQAVAEGHAERDFPIILVVIEEVQALTEYFTRRKVDIGYYLRMFLTRTRKTGIDIVACSQADSVAALGLKGFSQNKTAFALARTSGRDGRGHKVEYTNEEGHSLVYDPPPFWPDTAPVGVSQQHIYQLPPPPSSEQTQIISLLKRGATRYQICEALWAGKRGEGNYNRIDDVIRLWGPF